MTLDLEAMLEVPPLATQGLEWLVVSSPKSEACLFIGDETFEHAFSN